MWLTCGIRAQSCQQFIANVTLYTHGSGVDFKYMSSSLEKNSETSLKCSISLTDILVLVSWVSEKRARHEESPWDLYPGSYIIDTPQFGKVNMQCPPFQEIISSIYSPQFLFLLTKILWNSWKNQQVKGLIYGFENLLPCHA